ncbi:hypothetical protein BC830DRAFT_1127659 [Chytriomyces sp. MP71]|nr:hypothetical protein BC830DRAFT_1127659 [Chytriomyces sp. MP71]
MEAAVKALSAWKKEAEKTVKQTSQAMQDSVSRTQELELSLSSVRQEFERRGNLIVELQEQLEDSRSQLLDMNDGINPATVPPSSKLKKKSSQVWEWMPWPESFRSKPAEPKTLASLVEEVEETKKTREEAYQKLKKDMDGMMGKFAGSVKSSVSSGWSAVSSVSSSVSTSVSSSLSNITVPQQLLGSPGEKGTTAKSPTTSAKSSARNGPPKRKPTPVAYSHILSEYY